MDLTFTISIIMTTAIGLTSLMRHTERKISPYEKSFVMVILLSFLLSLSFTMIQHKSAQMFSPTYVFWKQAIMVLSVILGLLFIYFVHNVIWVSKLEKLFWGVVFVFSGIVFLKFYVIMHAFHQGSYLYFNTFIPVPAIPYFIFYISLFLILLFRMFSFSKRIQNIRRKAFVTNMLGAIVLLLAYFSILMIAGRTQAFILQVAFTVWVAHLIFFEMRYLKDEITWDIHILIKNLSIFTFIAVFLFGMDKIFQLILRSPISLRASLEQNLVFAPVCFFGMLFFSELVKECDRNFFSKLYFFKERCMKTGIFARSVFDMQTFQEFAELLFEDFPAFRDVQVLSFSRDGSLRITRAGHDQMAPVPEREREIIEHIFSFPFVTRDYLSDVFEKEDSLFYNTLLGEHLLRYYFPLVKKEDKYIAFILETRRHLSRKEVNTIIEEKGNMLLALNNVFIFEKEREKALTNVLEKEEAERLGFLKKQNVKLKGTYLEIQRVQDDLLKKERKASIVQITLSLDSEISNPLTNILIPLQYLLTKLKGDEPLKEKRLTSIMEIIESESKKIKTILEQLRKLIEKWGKKGVLDERIMKSIETDFSRIVDDGKTDNIKD